MKFKHIVEEDEVDEFAEDELAAEALAVAPRVTSKNLRLLKWNEVVQRGDFVPNDQQGFEPWRGPSGFQADSFVKPIYRPTNRK